MRRWLAESLAFLMLLTALPMGAAQAAMVSTTSVIERSTGAEAVPAEARERVLGFLNREDVRAEMERLGVDPEEAAARVNAMSPAEIAMIDGKLANLPAGESAVGAIVGAILVIFLVLLLTDLLCLTNVFPFTKCMRN